MLINFGPLWLPPTIKSLATALACANILVLYAQYSTLN